MSAPLEDAEGRGSSSGRRRRPEQDEPGRVPEQQASLAETTLDSSINQLGLARCGPTMKPSRSLSIIIGDHGRSTSHLNNLHLCSAHCCEGRRTLQRHDQPEAFSVKGAAGARQQQQQQRHHQSQNHHQNHHQNHNHNQHRHHSKACGRVTSKFGHQLHAQFSMPCSLNSRRPDQHTYQIHHALVDEQIVYCQLSIVAKKDFAEEVRALLDIRKFVTDSFILTDVSEVRIETIVGSIIERLVECRQLGHQVGEEAKTLLFLERGSLSMVLANTMQGLYKSRSDGRLAYDHSWIVATCSLSGLQKRQVAIARFAQPVNFGRQSREVRFLIIVLAPSKEKLTKSAWETGRTFATMFTDIEFRRRLLKAKSQDEIKVELLVRAESLAREASNAGPHNSSSAHCNPASVLCSSSSSSASTNDDDDDDDDDENYHQQRHRAELEELDELERRIVQRQEEAAAVAAARHQPEGRKSGSGGGGSGNGEENGNANGGATSGLRQLPMSSIDLFDSKMLQRQQAELRKRREQLRALSSSAPHARERASASSAGSSAGSSGKHFRERAGPAGAALGAGRCCARCLPGAELAGSALSKLGAGLLDDLKRRSRFYLSDFTDGFLGERSLYKTISTTIFLYFSVLLPCIAFGVVDTNNTDGAIDPKKTMIGQALGGLFFALFSGQPLVVVMTTAPLCIYVKLIYQISQDLEVDFGSFYACVGLWMALFLFLMSVTNASHLMKHCTRSTEDIFALFTAFAFGSDGIKEAIRSFQKYYWEPDCLIGSANGAGQLAHNLSAPVGARLVAGAGAALAASAASSAANSPMPEYHGHHTASSGGHTASAAAAAAASSLLNNQADQGLSLFSRCQRETSILFLFLMCGTLWLANSFNSFDRTPYLSSRKREIIKDYALAISVLIFSFIGSYLFSEIRLDVFEFSDFAGLHVAQLGHLSWPVWATGGLLGFMASVLFYIDQNICAAMVNNAPYKLKKGNYFHLDLLVLALLNAFLSLTGLPWMHGKLPHSHLHSKALADYEERVDEGHIHQMIVNIRETRLTGTLVSLLVALSLLAVPYPLSYIPLPVLSGVFLYTALSEFKSNSMVERICLLFTEQVAYPPNHYIRRCPQRKIHLFTLTQIVQLAIVSFIGFYPNPYVNMAFPLAVATFVPVRELLLPKLIDAKYLHSLDSASLE